MESTVSHHRRVVTLGLDLQRQRHFWWASVVEIPDFFSRSRSQVAAVAEVKRNVREWFARRQPGAVVRFRRRRGSPTGRRALSLP